MRKKLWAPNNWGKEKWEEVYWEKHRRKKFSEIKESFKTKNSLEEILELIKKIDKELIAEFKEKYPDLELENNQIIAVNYFFWERVVQVCNIWKDWSRTFLWCPYDDYLS